MQIKHRVQCPIILLLMLSRSAFADRRVLTSPSKAKEIFRFHLDEASGDLGSRTSLPMPGLPSVMTTSPSPENFHVAFPETRSVGAYEIEWESGKPTRVKNHTAGPRPWWV